MYVTPHRVVEGKNGIINGQQRVLAIDTGTDPQEGEAMLSLIRRIGALRLPGWPGSLLDALSRGGDPATIPEHLAYEPFIGTRLAPGRHGLRDRHQRTAATMVREALAASGAA